MLILCYHELHEAERTLWSLKPESFQQHLSYLAGSGYTFGPLWPPPDPTERRVVLTFDDGASGCSKHALPLLEQYGIQAYFYICPGFTNGTVRYHNSPEYMPWDDVYRLAETQIIGAHSMKHPVFDRLPRTRRRMEIEQSRYDLQSILDVEIRDFATPHGYYDAEVREIVQAAGYTTLVTTEPGMNRVPDQYSLQRLEVHSPCPLDVFQQQLKELECSSSPS